MMFPHDFNMFLDGAWSVFNVVLFIAIVINIVLFVKKINRMNKYIDQQEKQEQQKVKSKKIIFFPEVQCNVKERDDFLFL